jgi:hypothetical protein
MNIGIRIAGIGLICIMLGGAYLSICNETWTKKGQLSYLLTRDGIVVETPYWRLGLKGIGGEDFLMQPVQADPSGQRHYLPVVNPSPGNSFGVRFAGFTNMTLFARELPAFKSAYEYAPRYDFGSAVNAKLEIVKSTDEELTIRTTDIVGYVDRAIWNTSVVVSVGLTPILDIEVRTGAIDAFQFRNQVDVRIDQFGQGSSNPSGPGTLEYAYSDDLLMPIYAQSYMHFFNDVKIVPDNVDPVLYYHLTEPERGYLRHYIALVKQHQFIWNIRSTVSDCCEEVAFRLPTSERGNIVDFEQYVARGYAAGYEHVLRQQWSILPPRNEIYAARLQTPNQTFDEMMMAYSRQATLNNEYGNGTALTTWSGHQNIGTDMTHVFATIEARSYDVFENTSLINRRFLEFALQNGLDPRYGNMTRAVNAYPPFRTTADDTFDGSPSTIIAVYRYIMSTRDLSSWAVFRPYTYRIMSYLMSHSDNYLFVIPETNNDSVVWWDYLRVTGKDIFTNTLYYEALKDMSKLEYASGNNTGGDYFESYATKTRAQFNKLFWNPEGGFYTDWVDPQGGRHDYFFLEPNCHAIIFGLANSTQAETILRNIDLWKLKNRWDEKIGFGSPSNLYPVSPPDFISPAPPPWFGRRIEESQQPFGTEENGGIWPNVVGAEILARAYVGQYDKATELLNAWLNRWANGKPEIDRYFIGGHCFNWTTGYPPEVISPTITGNEPYHADALAYLQVALYKGIFGISFEVDGIDLDPHLSPQFDGAIVTINYHGSIIEFRYHGFGNHIRSIIASDGTSFVGTIPHSHLTNGQVFEIYMQH